jgi:transcriptional regulator with XRE-family HTH domain
MTDVADLVAWREARGLRQDFMAYVFGVKHRTYQYWEGGVSSRGNLYPILPKLVSLAFEEIKLRLSDYDKITSALEKFDSDRLQKIPASMPNFKSNRAATRAKYNAAKLQRTPQWLTDIDIIEIKEYYRAASLIGAHVDHIVPLQGKNISGLHVPWNLQLLHPRLNIRKSNKHVD